MRYFNIIAKSLNISLILFIILLFATCKNPIPEEKTSNLNDILDSMVTEQYIFLKSIEENEYFWNIDSIYNQGNTIINNYEKGQNSEEDFFKFLNKFGNEEFVIKNISHIDNLKSSVRMIQLNYINVYLKSFIQSYYQVDRMGLIPFKNEIYKNRNEVIELFPIFLNRSNIPIVLINNDTLEYTGSSYLFKCCYEEPGEYNLDTEIIIKCWGDTKHIKHVLKIVVK